MGGVKIAAGKVRPDVKPEHRVVDTFPTPAQDDGGPFLRDKKLVNDFSARNRVGPLRPWIRVEALEAGDAVGGIDAGRVTLGAERESIQPGFDFRIEAVDEDHAPCGRRGRGEEERVIASRANAGDRSAGKAAEAIRFEPFGLFVFRPDGECHALR